MSKKRVAIAIVGLPRDFKKTVPTLVERVLDSDKNRDFDFDIFLVCYRKYYNKEIASIIENTKRGQLKSVFLLDDNHLTYEASSKSNTFLRAKDLNNFLEKAKSNSHKYFIMKDHVLPQFCQMNYAKEQIQNSKIKYDLIVKTRYDVLYEENIDLNQVFKHDVESNVFMCGERFAYRYEDAPNNGYTKRTLKNSKFGKINDPFVAGSHNNMLDFFSLAESRPTLDRNDCAKTEDFVTYYITKILNKGMKVIDYKMGLWRDINERFEKERRIVL